MTTTFQASVQYGDWEGTCAADDSDQEDIFHLLRGRGLIKDGQFPVGITVYIGENQGGKVEQPYVEFLLIDRDNADEAAAALMAKEDPPDLIKVTQELTVEEFLRLFKRFSICIARRGLAMTGREYATNR